MQRRLEWPSRLRPAPARSRLEPLSDRRDVWDVPGGDNGSGERGERIDQLLELLAVEGVVRGKGDAPHCESLRHAFPFIIVIVSGRHEDLAWNDSRGGLQDIRFPATDPSHSQF
jgi:hypothetical protein